MYKNNEEVGYEFANVNSHRDYSGGCERSYCLGESTKT